MLEGWKVQEVLSYPLFPDTSTEQSAAGARRGEACVTVFERRSHLGPPAEGRPGPSDDDDDDDDDDNDDDDDERIFDDNNYDDDDESEEGVQLGASLTRPRALMASWPLQSNNSIDSIHLNPSGDNTKN